MAALEICAKCATHVKPGDACPKCGSFDRLPIAASNVPIPEVTLYGLPPPPDSARYQLPAYGLAPRSRSPTTLIVLVVAVGLVLGALATWLVMRW